MSDFPDYEAMALILDDIFRGNGPHHSITDVLKVAFGDKVLYEKIKAFQPRMCGHRYDYVQVWPKEDNDEGSDNLSTAWI